MPEVPLASSGAIGLLADELRREHELLDLAQHLLTRHVGRMRLAGEKEQQRTFRVVHEASQPRAILQQQRRTLVRGEATREADGERVRPIRIEMLRDVTPLRGAQSLASVLALQTLTHAGEHTRLHRLRCFPELRVRQVLDGVPELAVAQALTPIVTDGAIEMALPRLMDERRRVNPVRDESHRIVFRPDLRPVIRTESRRHDAMNAAHAVHASRAVERKTRHVEEAGHRRRTTEIQEAIDRQAKLANEVIKVRDEQLVAERVVTGSYRSVRGERALACYCFKCSTKRQATRQMLS
jgi:hypothetical protein